MEAVHLMKHLKMVKRCPFVNDDSIFKKNMDDYDFSSLEWLSYTARTNDFFVVIDNTEFF